MSGQPRTGIEVTASHSSMLWMLRWSSVFIRTDNGEPLKTTWGTHFIEQTPGKHNIKVSMVGKSVIEVETHAASMNVMVEEGKVTKVKYEIPAAATTTRATTTGKKRHCLRAKQKSEETA